MNSLHDDNDGFDPDQLKAMSELMDEIALQDGDGFEMVFWISNREARNLVKLYDEYVIGGKVGDPQPFVDQCMVIASFLKEVMEDEQDG